MMIEAPHRATDVESLFRLLEVALGRFLLGMVGELELAEDLLQETFLTACRWPERLASASSAEAWLFGVARHQALSALRRRYRLRAALTRAAPRDRDTYELPAAARGAIELVAPLAPEDRALVLLRYCYGFEAAELAEITNRTPAAVRKRLERCRASLAAHLTASGGGGV
jgi:RNA polymerase sigma-70 factor (ECF subfamily)